jgi:hypothetical protein
VLQVAIPPTANRCHLSQAAAMEAAKTSLCPRGLDTCGWQCKVSSSSQSWAWEQVLVPCWLHVACGAWRLVQQLAEGGKQPAMRWCLMTSCRWELGSALLGARHCLLLQRLQSGIAAPAIGYTHSGPRRTTPTCSAAINTRR